MFSLFEKVVYPGHGVAQISGIEEKNVAGKTTQFIELKFLNRDMTILIPIDNLISVGIRKLSSDHNINKILKMLAEPVKQTVPELTTSNWNKRNKRYKSELIKGDLNEICKIYKDLLYIAQHKELSFGEKNLLQQTEAIMAQEISIVKGINEQQAIAHLRSLCDNNNNHPCLM